MATQPNANNGYIRFELEHPQTVTLASMDPTLCRGFKDELQHMYKLAGGKVMYVPPGVSKYFQEHGLHPGRPVTITKGRAPDGHNTQWTVKLAEPEEKTIPIIWAGQKASAILKDAKLEEYDVMPSQPVKLPDTRMTSALKTAVEAAWQAELFGEEIGYPVKFSSQDVRAMAISINIGMGSGRG